MNGFWIDELGGWVHLACGRRVHPLVRDVCCGHCRVTLPRPAQQAAAARPAVKLPAWYGGRR